MAIRILHTINGLQLGGAETMLLRLLKMGKGDQFDPVVLSLLNPIHPVYGSLAPQIAALGVPVATLDVLRGRPRPAQLWRLCRTVREIAPKLIQGWMYHGNLAATLGSWSLPQRPPALWNVRHSVHDLTLEKPLTRLIIRLSARLSHLPAAIIYNSRVSAAQHARLGFDTSRATVIPNGFDGARLKPRPEARGRLCHDLGVDPTRTIIGMVARNHPMKDPGNLLRAVGMLHARGYPVHLVMVGGGLDGDEFVALAHEIGLNSRVSMLGERADVPELVAGFDIAALSSAWGEGFPNVLGEAMASGVPCVATDVGDCGWVVGPHGFIVPPRQSEALADALGRLIDLGDDARRELGLAGRRRILQHFSIEEVVQSYEALYRRVSGAQALRRPWWNREPRRLRHHRAS
jgi:glycosyltransferase involved in cell wall biosynthesis